MDRRNEGATGAKDEGNVILIASHSGGHLRGPEGRLAMPGFRRSFVVEPAVQHYDVIDGGKLQARWIPKRSCLDQTPLRPPSLPPTPLNPKPLSPGLSAPLNNPPVLKEHGFSRAIGNAKSSRPSSPEGWFPSVRLNPDFFCRPFSPLAKEAGAFRPLNDPGPFFRITIRAAQPRRNPSQKTKRHRPAFKIPSPETTCRDRSFRNRMARPAPLSN